MARQRYTRNKRPQGRLEGEPELAPLELEPREARLRGAEVARVALRTRNRSRCR